MTSYRVALVTGASAGIGEAYVRQLAKVCEHIVVVARREERLRDLAEALSGECRIDPLVADLASVVGQARVVEAIRQLPVLDVLINNAGFSTFGMFADSQLDDEISMLRVHQEATLALTRAALPGMRERKRGAVINVSSIGAAPGMPGVAVYGASKAFLLSFSRSLHLELRDSPLRVQCLCPGYTRTEIHSRESFRGFDVDRVPEALWMESEVVVAESLAALSSDEQGWLVVPGSHNRKLMREALDELRGLLTD